jgi:hypothetical protein
MAMIESKVPGPHWYYFGMSRPKNREGGTKQIVVKGIQPDIIEWMSEQGLTEDNIRWSERPEPFIQFETESQAVLFRLVFGT